MQSNIAKTPRSNIEGCIRLDKDRKMFSLRVDVDTIKGLTQGVPRLLDILDRFQVRVTFFITMGPDNTGKNLFHLSKRRNVVLGGVSPLRKFGLQQMLYGLLIPPPKMEHCVNVIKKIHEKGHEIGFHGYNHYHWANYFHQMSTKDIEGQISNGISALMKLIGIRPRGFASPAFKWGINSLLIADKWKFTYSSDMYGKCAFYPKISGKKLDMLQIPITEPLIEELVNQRMTDAEILARFRKRMINQNFITMYIHPIYEILCKDYLVKSILKFVKKDKSISILTFGEIAEKLKEDAITKKIK